jgi:hypothetical protein|tara:strand:+ start:5200 stop:5412 length:213 start_codon:yes stop_codon:yes gene_type:complete
MKGREVREALQGKIDPTVVHCIASVAEETSALGQEIHALAALLDQITDVLGGVTETMHSVKTAVERSHDL